MPLLVVEVRVEEILRAERHSPAKLCACTVTMMSPYYGHTQQGQKVPGFIMLA